MKILVKVVALSVAAFAIAGSAHAAGGKRMTVTGEVIDTWCYLTEIMYPEGTAHHRCAVWCAAGGIPVGLKDDDGDLSILIVQPPMHDDSRRTKDGLPHQHPSHEGLGRVLLHIFQSK